MAMVRRMSCEVCGKCAAVGVRDVLSIYNSFGMKECIPNGGAHFFCNAHARKAKDTVVSRKIFLAAQRNYENA